MVSFDRGFARRVQVASIPMIFKFHATSPEAPPRRSRLGLGRRLLRFDGPLRFSTASVGPQVETSPEASGAGSTSTM